MPKTLANACLRLQMLPTVELRIGNASAFFRHRSKGCLTGTRLAFVLGRIPIESTARALFSSISMLGFPTPEWPLVLAVWVDNVFSTGESPSQAISIIEDFAEHVLNDWGLHISAQSKQCLR